MQKLGVSERKTCNVLKLSRTAKRYKFKKSDDEQTLKNAIIRLASQYGRYGYRRITAMLRAEGWKVNHRRVERIWREVCACRKNRKNEAVFISKMAHVSGLSLCIRTMFGPMIASRLANGRKIKMLTVIDEYTRESLEIRVEKNITSKHVLDTISYR